MTADDPLLTPLQYLKGVGPKRAELLEKLSLRTVSDFLWRLPRDYLDLTEVRSPDQLEADLVQTVRGRVVDLDGRLLSSGKLLSSVLLDCGKGYVRGVWFNQTWVNSRFRGDQWVLFSGKPKMKSGRWEFSHPRIQWLTEGEDAAEGAGILPRYGLTEGLSMHEMRRVASEIVESYAHYLPDPLPAEYSESLKLQRLSEAFRIVHSPTSMEQLIEAKRSIIFQDLLDFQLALALKRRIRRGVTKSSGYPVTTKIDSRIRRLFPFSFTEGQEKAIQEICLDLSGTIPMHRLLQADVGAGKTVIAIYAMLVVIAAGHQALIMAPTELLASQHWGTINRILTESRVQRVLLTGNLTSNQRHQALSGITDGSIQLIVGTQALIQQGVKFKNLGLAVIDEQHRFGVAQRAHFSVENEGVHILVMTATPIPRSLCLTQFGDLDLTLVTELPPGRQRISTRRVTTPEVRQKAWIFVREKLESGRQAYIVCPRVESTDNPESSAIAFHELVQQTELKGYRVGLIHGQMDRETRHTTMEAFRNKELDVLVSTTVIEVGVDVPNATILIVMQAERYGLSQLHQLRGRVARGTFPGYCFLVTESATEEANSRLSALESTSDGFRIAEIDFELRGPGDLLGTRQHGELPFLVADLTRDQEILQETRRAAWELVSTGQIDLPEFRSLKVRVLERFGEAFDLGNAG